MLKQEKMRVSTKQQTAWTSRPGWDLGPCLAIPCCARCVLIRMLEGKIAVLGILPISLPSSLSAFLVGRCLPRALAGLPHSCNHKLCRVRDLTEIHLEWGAAGSPTGAHTHIVCPLPAHVHAHTSLHPLWGHHFHPPLMQTGTVIGE